LPNETKSFAYRYKFDGQSKQLSIGKYPVFSLADARLKVLELQRLIADGVDPKQIRQERKQEQDQARILEQTKQVTFKQAFDDYCRFKSTPAQEVGSASWTYQTMKKHIERVNNYVRRYPKGEVPTKISAIKGNWSVLKVLFKASFGGYNP
jgi:hypothetical protein